MKVKSILLTFIAALIMVSCYKFTLIEQPHEAVTNSVFNGKVVVKRSGTSDNGKVQHCYGLFGICVPDGWKATAVPTILLNNYINYCKSDCYERKIARWISESDLVL